MTDTTKPASTPSRPGPDLDRIEQIANEFVTLGVSEEAVEPIRDWVRDRRDGKPQRVVFFGTWQQAGHYLWLPNMRHPKRDDPTFGWNAAGPWKRLDGTLTPRDTRAQSMACVHHMDGWTAIAMHDYTVDSRGGSNAVFVMDSEVSFDRALTNARLRFPKVVERIEAAAPIRLAETCLDCKGGHVDDRR